jgi:hypothetical protein
MVIHLIIVGTALKGEEHSSSKLTEANIIDIRSRPESYGINTQLAIEYKVSNVTISAIRRRKIWNHI